MRTAAFLDNRRGMRKRLHKKIVLKIISTSVILNFEKGLNDYFY